MNARNSYLRTIGLSSYFFAICLIGLANAQTDPTPEELKQYFFQATTEIPVPNSNGSGRLPIWHRESLKIGFFVEGENKGDVLMRLSPEIEVDRRFISSATELELPVGLWSDQDPPPNIFIIIGEPDKLIARAHFLSERFVFPELIEKFEQGFTAGDGLCNSFGRVAADQEILYALITVDLTNQPSYCIRRQLMVVLGLTEDLPPRTNSILASDQNQLHYTDIDGYPLRVLYHNEIDLADIDPVVAEVLN